MSGKSRLVPAILARELNVVKDLVRVAETFAPYVQIDIMDGQFVPSHSIHPRELISLKVNIPFEIHLMVNRPLDYLEDCQKAGAKKAIFHLEAVPDPREIIQRARSLGLEIGLAINPETTVKEALPCSKEIDSLLFLSVHPGFYGKPFIDEVLDKLIEFRQLSPGVETGIDGGVKENNLLQVASTGVDSICLGSAVFGQPDPGESYRHLLSILEEDSIPTD